MAEFKAEKKDTMLNGHLKTRCRATETCHIEPALPSHNLVKPVLTPIKIRELGKIMQS